MTLFAVSCWMVVLMFLLKWFSIRGMDCMRIITTWRIFWWEFRFCSFPQELVLELKQPSQVINMQLLCHEYKVSSSSSLQFHLSSWPTYKIQFIYRVSEFRVVTLMMWSAWQLEWDAPTHIVLVSNVTNDHSCNCFVKVLTRVQCKKSKVN